MTSYATQFKQMVGIAPKPEEQIRRWRASIRQESRAIDRQIQALTQASNKAQLSLKDCARRKDAASGKLIAKEIFRTKKAKDRLVTSKAQLNSLMMQLQHQVALVKVTGSLERSTEIMKTVNGMVKLPQIGRTMQELAKEMTKAGVIEEMLEDTLEIEEESDLEEEASEEVEKILFDVTNGRLGQAGSVDKLQKVEIPSPEEQEVDEEVEKRLAALKSM